MRIFLTDIKYFIKNNDPISADWIVYGSTTTGIDDEELFRSMDDEEHIYAISPSLKDSNGRDVRPEELTELYVDIRLNYVENKDTSFKRFYCTQQIRS